MSSIEFYEVSIEVYMHIVVHENIKSYNSIYIHFIKMFITYNLHSALVLTHFGILRQTRVTKGFAQDRGDLEL